MEFLEVHFRAVKDHVDFKQGRRFRFGIAIKGTDQILARRIFILFVGLLDKTLPCIFIFLDTHTHKHSATPRALSLKTVRRGVFPGRRNREPLRTFPI